MSFWVNRLRVPIRALWFDLGFTTRNRRCRCACDCNCSMTKTEWNRIVIILLYYYSIRASLPTEEFASSCHLTLMSPSSWVILRYIAQIKVSWSLSKLEIVRISGLPEYGYRVAATAAVEVQMGKAAAARGPAPAPAAAAIAAAPAPSAPAAAVRPPAAALGGQAPPAPASCDLPTRACACYPPITRSHSTLSRWSCWGHLQKTNKNKINIPTVVL